MKRQPKPEGIVVRCVACHEKKTLSFEDASALTDMPFCERCHMPMVAISATVRPQARRTQE